ncbi:hypothetical protein ACFWII_10445 [Streptomyces sp. NPDC127063]|uniref:hypothetical protein n=1 Tax=Streptomyces sp. NPDC127063 TaxID=3347123 RepID=UPI003652AF9F
MSDLVTVVFAAALVVIVASLAAVAAAKLARMEGATYPTAVTRAALTFAGTLTLAAAVTGALPGLRS